MSNCSFDGTPCRGAEALEQGTIAGEPRDGVGKAVDVADLGQEPGGAVRDHIGHAAWNVAHHRHEAAAHGFEQRDRQTLRRESAGRRRRVPPGRQSCPALVIAPRYCTRADSGQAARSCAPCGPSPTIVHVTSIDRARRRASISGSSSTPFCPCSSRPAKISRSGSSGDGRRTTRRNRNAVRQVVDVGGSMRQARRRAGRTCAGCTRRTRAPRDRV